MAKKEEYAIDTTLCGDALTSKNEAYEAWNNYRKLDTQVNNCYCLQLFKEIGSEQTKIDQFVDGVNPCAQWLEDYNLASNLGLLVSIAMAALNGTLRTVLRKSSFVEGHHTVT